MSRVLYSVQSHMTNDSAENMSHVQYLSHLLSAFSGRQTAGKKQFLRGFAITLAKIYTWKKLSISTIRKVARIYAKDAQSSFTYIFICVNWDIYNFLQTIQTEGII
jgi:hypothetical protein